ncbi:hypothetical protein JOD45_003084 [Scopulibacillus daqui]|uniref:Uncharacterized protein n=1 Tax=Scopulibacillus daqui TaxID=1469162 RepID=A0ABS2Q3H7_9BACL|nr:hypothetical protein [Scopulibacillus daqui]MBM7646850.1 hypothetical protein [Scopulibacillus daqui]
MYYTKNGYYHNAHHYPPAPKNRLDYYYKKYLYHARMCEFYYKKIFGDYKGESAYYLPPNIEVKEKWKNKTTYEKTYTPVSSHHSDHFTQ